MYLAWQDLDKKKSSSTKLNDAILRYEQQHDSAPRVALVNAVDFDGLQARADIEIRVVRHVAPNTFFVGVDDDPSSVLS